AEPMKSGIFLRDEAATLAFGRSLAEISQGRGLITLSGDLGSGKTTLSRALIQSLGHTGAVKSPTYTLVEPYELPGSHVLHYDLYRLNDPEELHFLGVRDFLDADTLTLIEWPERGKGWLPAPDLALTLTVAGGGRQLSWQAGTERGRTWSQLLSRHAS
ncbi:MAG TPA: tRNA (adenosine(37)-N6)-threonylcarbamoyltransferase complex ATPase subunit type 1 TsaE, partial [Candidatus Acidoferrum sp.]|nr:tRNA (adenosine(37)-N6)-threonylcarbamoyltransferase complex ATPase subunit type 1 TsaE [Candidatus Acidoferrum sp.]